MRGWFNIPDLPLTDPIPIFLLVLLIILAAPVLNKIKIPQIIGLILAGVLFGPFGLNVLSNDASFELFGKVGILYIMFQAGLEIDLNTFKQNGGKSLIFGIYTFVLPMLFGILSGMYLLGLDFIRATLVASMYASHTLIAYPIVSKMGLSKHRAVGITIAGTIITVTASLLILAVIVAMTQGEMSGAFWIKFGVSSVVFCGIVFGLMPLMSKWFLGKFHDGVVQYIFVLAVIFLASLCAQAAGLEGILGAFFAGLILNRLIPSVSPLMNRIEFVGNAIFIPFFLISIGMQIDLKAFVTGVDALKVSAVMSIVATGTKWGAAKLSQITSKLSKTEGDLIFGLSNGQAAATLAAAMIGYKIGLIDDNILNGTVVMILVTCAISSIVTERAARKIAIADNKREVMLQKLGIEKILIPISNPQTMPMLMNMSYLLKQKSNTDALHALKINSVNSSDADSKLMEQAAKMAASTENNLTRIVKTNVNVANCIMETAHEYNISDILVGIHQKANIIDTFLGSTLSSLISGTAQHTLFIYGPKKDITSVRRLVVAVVKKAEFESGFEIWFDRLKNIATQLNVPTLIFSGKTTTVALKQLCEMSGMGNVEFNEMRDDFEAIAEIIKPTDTLIVVTARQSTVSYNSQCDRLPEYLTKYFSDNNFLIVYPKQSDFVEEEGSAYHTLKIG